MINVTHWRMQAGLRGLSKCLMLLMVNHPEAYAEHCDATASWAELGSVLRIGMRAEQAVCPKLHPMRLETFGMWCSIPYEYQGLVRGHADAVGTVPEDLEPLRAFWEGQRSDHPPS